MFVYTYFYSKPFNCGHLFKVFIIYFHQKALSTRASVDYIEELVYLGFVYGSIMVTNLFIFNKWRK